MEYILYTYNNIYYRGFTTTTTAVPTTTTTTIYASYYVVGMDRILHYPSFSRVFFGAGGGVGWQGVFSAYLFKTAESRAGIFAVASSLDGGWMEGGDPFSALHCCRLLALGFPFLYCCIYSSI